MKKLILSVFAMASLALAANAVTNMCVKTSDGKVVKYDVENVTEVYYEEETSTPVNQDVTVSGKVGDYDYVDLGLPSGLMWATCNVGATKPTEYGEYFTWGDVQSGGGCREYYKWIEVVEFGTYERVTKYCTNDEQGLFDGIAVLDTADDAASVNMGRAWRMPSSIEQQELIDGCDWKKIENFNGTGVAGNLGTSKANGNTIFLPAAGYLENCFNADAFDAGNGGYYWSSSLDEKNCMNASINNSGSIQSFERFFASSVRGVLKP